MAPPDDDATAPLPDHPDFPPSARRLFELLGVTSDEGATSVVLRVRQLRTGRILAMKVLREKYASNQEIGEQIRLSSLVLRQLGNVPNLERFVDLFESPERGPVLLLEHIEGCSLEKWLAPPRTRMGVPDVIELVKDVGTCLCGLHEHGLRVVHSDIKPGNIMRRRDGGFTVIDTGYSVAGWRPAGDGSRGYWVRVEGPAFGGTPAYMPPEQRAGCSIDRRADVYAFMCVVFRALTGQRWVDVRASTHPFTLLPAGLPASLARRIEPGLHDDRDSRLPGLDELVQELNRGARRRPAARPAQVVALPDQPREIVGRSAEIERTIAALRVAGAVALVGLPGMGKPTVALGVARGLLAREAAEVTDGACLVDCAHLQPGTSVDDLAGLVSKTLRHARKGGRREGDSACSATQLAGHLRGRRMLLVLAHAEGVSGAVAELRATLRPCRDLLLLTTAAASIDGFEPQRVGGLSCAPTVVDGESDAVLLLRQELKAKGAEVAATPEVRALLHRVARHVSGTPAIIRLLPAPYIVLGLHGLVGELENGGLVEPTDSTAFVARLSDMERRLLGCLAFFHVPIGIEIVSRALLDEGAATPHTAGSDSDESTLLLSPVGEAIYRAVRGHLVERVEGADGAPPRFALPEALRAAALAALTAEQREAFGRRHLEWIARECEDAPRGPAGQFTRQWSDRVVELHLDLMTGLSRAERQRNGAVVALLANQAVPNWIECGQIDAAERWIAAALAHDGAVSAPVRAELLLRSGLVPLKRWRLDDAARTFRRALDAAERLPRDDPRAASQADDLKVKAMINLAVALQRRGSPDDDVHAVELHVEAAQLARSNGADRLADYADINRASALINLGALDQAEALLRGFAVRRDALPPGRVALVLLNLGQAAALRENVDDARRFTCEALAINVREVGNHAEQVEAVLTLAVVAALQGREDFARYLVENAVTWYARLGMPLLPLHRKLADRAGAGRGDRGQLSEEHVAGRLDDLVAHALET